MKALLVVDVQNDFCPGGALAVEDGDAIVEGINAIASGFEIVITTQDYHPKDHGSFASNHEGASLYDMGELSGKEQVLWPDHCVQGTEGVMFHRQLNVKGKNFVKGTSQNADSYSGFFDDDGKSTGLNEYLQEMNIKELYICGLATDYCVKFTSLDALKEGYAVAVIEDLCRGVNLEPGDAEKALQEVRSAGGIVLCSEDIL